MLHLRNILGDHLVRVTPLLPTECRRCGLVALPSEICRRDCSMPSSVERSSGVIRALCSAFQRAIGTTPSRKKVPLGTACGFFRKPPVSDLRTGSRSHCVGSKDHVPTKRYKKWLAVFYEYIFLCLIYYTPSLVFSQERATQ